MSASDLRTKLQTRLGTAYIIERELGGGGMSRVFSAEETALGRKVVVKVLPDELTGGVNVDRFKREIQFAARMQHPHIVQVLTAGEMDGIPFYTMPFVEGESVRARLLRLGQLSITEVIGILRDVGKALAFAHDHGVVHRDIKPDNVLLSGGSAAVADFGIAKAISAARTDEHDGALTQIGTSIGTPAYMAPEQAAADPSTDHRADLYSFGCLAYELLAGHPPFIGKTPQKMLAAHMGETPRSIADLRPDTPIALADLVMRCLAKDADDRPQRAADIVHVLENVTSGGGHTAMPTILLGGQKTFRRALIVYGAAALAVPLLAKAATIAIGLPGWVFPGSIIVIALGLPVILFTAYVHRATRRAMTATPMRTPGGTPSVTQSAMATLALKASPHMSWGRTAMGGAYALGGFALLIAGFMGLRALGIGPAGSLFAAGVIGENEKILVADFGSQHGDTTLGPVVTEAFRTSFGQSRSISLVQQSAIRNALQLMQKPANTRIDFSVAREIATREGIRAVVDGEIIGVGGHYVISARLLSPQTGDVLASFRETADSDRQILEAIDNLAKDMRGRIGESLKSVRVTLPIERVTTPSLDALKKYVQAVQLFSTQSEWTRAQGLMNEAIAIDSGFAMAYRRLGMEYANRGDDAKKSELLSKAFEHRDRLSETERYLVLGSYYGSGANQDLARSNAAYEQLLELQPDNGPALNNLGLNYLFQRRFAEAEELYRRAIRSGATSGVYYSNLILTLLEEGKLAEADSIMPVFRTKFPRYPRMWHASSELLQAKRAIDSALASAKEGLLQVAGDGVERARFLDRVAALNRIQGKFIEADKLIVEASQLLAGGGITIAPLNQAITRSRVASWTKRDTPLAISILDAALARTPLSGITENQRPLGELAELNARLGRTVLAKQLQGEWEKRRSRSQDFNDGVMHNSVLGQIAITEGRYSVANDALRAADKEGCSYCLLPHRARAFELAGQQDSAISMLQKYVSAAGRDKMFSDAVHLAPSYEKLGELYEARSDRPNAIKNYDQFVKLWRNADADVQPRVTAVRMRVVALRSRVRTVQ